MVHVIQGFLFYIWECDTANYLITARGRIQGGGGEGQDSRLLGDPQTSGKFHVPNVEKSVPNANYIPLARVGCTEVCVGCAFFFRHQHVGIGITRNLVGGLDQLETPMRVVSRCSGI